MIDLAVLEGVEMKGNMNTSEDVIVGHVNHSIRLGYPQFSQQATLKPKRVAIVGGGPSLEDTFPELRELYFSGAEVVTVNGAYQWCLERNIRPSAQVVLDARAGNARFVDPPVPGCRYLVASQCHPDTWDAVKGRPQVWIWHAVSKDNPVLAPLLDRFYLGNWQPSAGGTTVVMRALVMLRLLGYVRFDLFGVDSCVKDGAHHAYEQAENDADKVYPFTLSPPGHPEMARTFNCTAWHAKQLECLLQTIRLYGDQFMLNIHGDGLLAYALQLGAQMEWLKRDG